LAVKPLQFSAFARTAVGFYSYLPNSGTPTAATGFVLS
jgi:hypothetical protein